MKSTVIISAAAAEQDTDRLPPCLWLRAKVQHGAAVGGGALRFNCVYKVIAHWSNDGDALVAWPCAIAHKGMPKSFIIFDVVAARGVRASRSAQMIAYRPCRKTGCGRQTARGQRPRRRCWPCMHENHFENPEFHTTHRSQAVNALLVVARGKRVDVSWVFAPSSSANHQSADLALFVFYVFVGGAPRAGVPLDASLPT